MAKTQEEILAERMAAREAVMAVQAERRKDFAPAEHKAIPLYENAPCYETEKLTGLQRLGAAILDTEERQQRLELISKFEDLRDSIKELVVFCAGGDHGTAMFHEGYGSCLDFIEMGYQTILLGNRTNGCPWKGRTVNVSHFMVIFR